MLDLRPIVGRAELMLLLGEAQSKCEHIAGVPVAPQVAAELHQLYLAKGIGATTAIEGNTLTTEQVKLALQGKLDLPPSRDYQRQEVDNILQACNWLVPHVRERDRDTPLSVDLVKKLNAMVLEGLPVEEEVIPGEIRRHSVGVFDYRGPPHERCTELLGRLCAWINELPNEFWPGRRIATALIKAIVVHVYVAWIHPFGDGNGRTARLLELLLLTEAGVSSPVAHLLSNHYNLTRNRYYVELSKTSKSGGRLEDFIEYALRGFVDGLVEQIGTVREHQIQVTWKDFIYESFRGKKTESALRRRDLAIALGRQGLRWTTRKELPALTHELGVAYSNGSEKMLTRDLNYLQTHSLIVRNKERGVVRARIEVVEAFFPPRKLQEPELAALEVRLEKMREEGILEPEMPAQLMLPETENELDDD